MTTPTPEGWYDDPNDPNVQRYWDGQDWTPHRQRKPSGFPSPSPQPPQQPASPVYAQPVAVAPPTPATPAPGWWQASDGNWYPPQQAGGVAAGASAPVVGIGAAFSYGLAKFQANAREILIAGGICLLGYAVVIGVTWMIMLSTMFSSAAIKGGVVLFLIALPLAILVPLVVFWLIQMVIIRGSLMIVNGHTPLVVGRMFSTEGVGPFALGAVIVSVATCIGFMMCYIPGLVFLFFAGYWAYFQIGKQLSPVDSIRASFSLVWNNLGTQLIFAFACFLIYWLGSLVCYFGLAVALPVIVIAQGYMWRRLQGEPVAP